jgi:hypothetical protein
MSENSPNKIIHSSCKRREDFILLALVGTLATGSLTGASNRICNRQLPVYRLISNTNISREAYFASTG